MAVPGSLWEIHILVLFKGDQHCMVISVDLVVIASASTKCWFGSSIDEKSKGNGENH
jgi:hypothetical protein